MSECTVEIQEPSLKMRFNTLKYRIKERFSKSNYMKHFERELDIMHENLELGDNLLIEDFIPIIKKIIKKFSKQGHSGGSAPYASGALSRTIKNVLTFKPLSPITGEDSEWGEPYNHDGSQQNKRLSAVFKKPGEKPFYLDAIVFQGPEDWDTFSGSVEDINSCQNIKFPFTPKTFYIDVIREKVKPSEDDYKSKDVVVCGDGSYVYSIKDRKQLKEVAEYYDMEIK